MSLVPIATVAEYCGAVSTDANLILIHNAVETWIASQCGRVLEESDYKERRDGDGTSYLTLYQYPVVDMSRVAIGRRAALKITGEGTVKVTETQIKLDSETIDLAGKTLEQLVAPAGWTIELYDDDYKDLPATELIPTYGLRADDTAMVYIPGLAASAYEVYGDGTIYLRDQTFTRGRKNILIEYKAGYSQSTCPADLAGAVLFACKSLWQLRGEEGEGLKAYSLGDISKTFQDTHPSLLADIINRYRIHPV